MSEISGRTISNNDGSKEGKKYSRRFVNYLLFRCLKSLFFNAVRLVISLVSKFDGGTKIKQYVEFLRRRNTLRCETQVLEKVFKISILRNRIELFKIGTNNSSFSKRRQFHFFEKKDQLNRMDSSEEIFGKIASGRNCEGNRSRFFF